MNSQDEFELDSLSRFLPDERDAYSALCFVRERLERLDELEQQLEHGILVYAAD